MLQGKTLQKILRRHACPRGEKTVKMKGAEPSAAGQIVERGLLEMTSIQVTDHVCNSFVVVHTRSMSLTGRIPTRFLLQF